MVLTGELSTHVPGPRRKNLLIAGVVAAAVLAAALWVIVTQFNERPPWAQNVGYEAGFYRGQQIRKMDRTGDKVKEAVAGGCEQWVADGGKKADDAPQSWVRGCLDAVRGLPSNPNEA
ncbi:hypothetical protein ACIO3O_24740 [Streptomyces sp. NPDC087440]|uniref:hypothetical protein n=1 Tax=Streptomyces sp. NPDC087440 TaxID=3365790 RepID=UPI0038187219